MLTLLVGSICVGCLTTAGLYFGGFYLFTMLVSASHVEGNVPDEKRFYPYLERDLLPHLQKRGHYTAARVTLLRDQPTQVGLSYPKFYVWVVARGTGLPGLKAAASVKAVNKTGFAVVSLYTDEQIRSTAEVYLDLHFPKDVVLRIRQLSAL